MNVFEQVKGLISSQLRIDPSTITLESRLLEDLRADSANVMMLVMDLEQELGVTMEDDALVKLKTVGDVVSYIEANL